MHSAIIRGDPEIFDIVVTDRDDVDPLQRAILSLSLYRKIHDELVVGRGKLVGGTTLMDAQLSGFVRDNLSSRHGETMASFIAALDLISFASWGIRDSLYIYHLTIWHPVWKTFTINQETQCIYYPHVQCSNT